MTAAESRDVAKLGRLLSRCARSTIAARGRKHSHRRSFRYEVWVLAGPTSDELDLSSHPPDLAGVVHDTSRKRNVTMHEQQLLAERSEEHRPHLPAMA